MVGIETFKKWALLFEEATEQPHFHKTSFRVKGKIFATLDLSSQRVSLKLSAADQSVFCSFDPTVMYPATGSWGRQGWTYAELKKIKKEMLKDALNCSYCNTAPKNLSIKYQQ